MQKTVSHAVLAAGGRTHGPKKKCDKKREKCDMLIKESAGYNMVLSGDVQKSDDEIKNEYGRENKRVRVRVIVRLERRTQCLRFFKNLI